MTRFPSPYEVAHVLTAKYASERSQKVPQDMQVVLTQAFYAAYPDGIFGMLIVRGCPNRPRALAITSEERAVEARLRGQFPGESLEAHPIARAYGHYFRRYGGRYPVVHQAKTVLAGRPIESTSALVEAMFTAELDSLILTSGHDLQALRGPLTVDVAVAGDAYTKLSGKDQMLKAGDMVVRDAQGIIASVAHGPDDRTRLQPETTAALFGAWCPVGIAPSIVAAHLAKLAALLRQEWTDAAVEVPEIWFKSRTQ